MSVKILYEPQGIGIQGKILTFECQYCKINPKRKQVSGRHRGITGRLSNATCVIDRCIESVAKRTPESDIT